MHKHSSSLQTTFKVSQVLKVLLWRHLLTMLPRYVRRKSDAYGEQKMKYTPRTEEKINKKQLYEKYACVSVYGNKRLPIKKVSIFAIGFPTKEALKSKQFEFFNQKKPPYARQHLNTGDGSTCNATIEPCEFGRKNNTTRMTVYL